MSDATNGKPWYRLGPAMHEAPQATPPRPLHLIGVADVPLRVFLRRAAWDAIEAAEADGRCQGLLLGSVSADANGPFVVIEDAVAVPAAADSDGDFLFAAWDLDELEEPVRARRPRLLVVGWFQARPGAGAALTPADRVASRRYFPEWWQLTYIIDPVRRRQALYCWQDGELRSLRGFWVCEHEDDVSDVTWAADVAAAATAGAGPGAIRYRMVWPALVALILLALWAVVPVPGSLAWLQRRVRDTAAEARQLQDELAVVQLQHQLLLLAAADMPAAEALPTTAAPATRTQAGASAAAPSVSSAPAATDASAPPAGASGSGAAGTDGYVVRVGDTLWSISQRLLGDPYLYRLVAEQNEIDDPDYILPGWRIRLPAPENRNDP